MIARDPHPAESRENVTHPHVMDEILCEGEGRHSIRQALAQGRLLDFFTLVAWRASNLQPRKPVCGARIVAGGSCGDCGRHERE